MAVSMLPRASNLRVGRLSCELKVTVRHTASRAADMPAHIASHVSAGGGRSPNVHVQICIALHWCSRLRVSQ